MRCEVKKIKEGYKSVVNCVLTVIKFKLKIKCLVSFWILSPFLSSITLFSFNKQSSFFFNLKYKKHLLIQSIINIIIRIYKSIVHNDITSKLFILIRKTFITSYGTFISSLLLFHFLS